MAEIEINVLVNHGLSKRIPAIKQMKKEAKAWNLARNEGIKKINWRFTTEDARIKLYSQAGPIPRPLGRLQNWRRLPVHGYWIPHKIHTYQNQHTSAL
jgi:hypothetical protein